MIIYYEPQSNFSFFLKVMETIRVILVDEVSSDYTKIEQIVNQCQMVCNSTSVTVGLEDIDKLVENVKILRNQIGFGSISSAVSHLLKYPVDPLEHFLIKARKVIELWEANVIINEAYIEIQFYLKCGDKWAKCCVLVFKTTLGVILATFMPENNKKDDYVHL